MSHINKQPIQYFVIIFIVFSLCLVNPAQAVFQGKAGDADGNNTINIQDVTSIINIILTNGTTVNGSDCNTSGEVNIQDVVCAINIVLKGSGGLEPPDTP